MRKKPELLAPAGDMEKLRMAVLYGADAVYLAGDRFGMRGAPKNFSLDELEEAAKAYGKSVYGQHLKKVAAGEIVNSPREY